MKLFDIIKEKIAKIPLISNVSAKLTHVIRPNQRRNSYYYTGWVYLAVSTIAQEIGGMQLKLFRDQGDGQVEQVFNHPSLDLIAHANNYMTQYDLFERLQSNIEMQGNEYWFVQYVGNIPVNLFPLPPNSVVPVQGQFEFVVGYNYTVDNQTFKIPKKNIIQFKQYNPFSDVVGYPTLQAARIAAETDANAKQYNKTYFENNARPDIILKYPDTLSEEDEKRLLQAWHQNHGGAERQFRTAVASGGLEIDAFQISQKDMEFLEGRKFNRDEIMMIFRVPLAVTGYTETSNRASAEAALYTFQRNTIKPKMQRIINSLNEFYLPLFAGTENMYFEFVNPVIEDREQIIKAYESGIKNGWLSINDVRRAEDLPEIQGGEDVFIPFSVQPLGGPVNEKSPKRNTPSSKIADSILKSIDFSKFKKKEVVEEPKPNPHPHLEGKTEAELQKFEKLGEFRVKQRDERGLTFENQFNAVLEELWSGQEQRAINNLIGAMTKGQKANAPNVIDKDKEVDITIDLFTPLFTNITEAEALAAADYLGLAIQEVTITPRLAEFIKSNTNKFAGEITDVTSKKLRATLAAGLSAGEDITQLEQRILDSTAFSPARAEVIARTETIRAQTHSEIEVWKDSEVVVEKIWYTALDERVCPICAPLHGKTISIEKNFFNKGETTPGEDGKPFKIDYEDVPGPPIHPNCRCTLVPVIKS